MKQAMALSKEIRLLQAKWNSGQGWPKRLEAIEITGIRGWSGQRIAFEFPIVALVGENGAGKSTVLQAAASVYRGPAKRMNSPPGSFLIHHGKRSRKREFAGGFVRVNPLERGVSERKPPNGSVI
jgi:predicted ATPase